MAEKESFTDALEGALYNNRESVIVTRLPNDGKKMQFKTTHLNQKATATMKPLSQKSDQVKYQLMVHNVYGKGDTPIKVGLIHFKNLEFNLTLKKDGKVFVSMPNLYSGLRKIYDTYHDSSRDKLANALGLPHFLVTKLNDLNSGDNKKLPGSHHVMELKSNCTLDNLMKIAPIALTKKNLDFYTVVPKNDRGYIINAISIMTNYAAYLCVSAIREFSSLSDNHFILGELHTLSNKASSANDHSISMENFLSSIGK